MSEQNFDLIVIGAGPGGYTAAIRAAQLGMRVAVVDKRLNLGGVCLNEGCIPSKALLESSELFALARDRFSNHGIIIPPPGLNLTVMMRRKNEVVKKMTEGLAYLFKKNKITFFHGDARLAGYNTLNLHNVEIALDDANATPPGKSDISRIQATLLTITGKKILLATGSEPVALPGIPFDGHIIVSAREALSLETVPERLVVIGGSYIGLEMASVWQRLGAQVTVIEMQPHILSSMDRQVSEAIYRSLRKQGIRFKLATRITAAHVSDSKAVVTYSEEDGEGEIECNRLLVAIGRRPVVRGAGLEDSGINLDETGRICIDIDYQTSLNGVYAVGDIIPGPMLAHKASYEAVTCVERMAGMSSFVNYATIPGVVYTFPEGAFIGKTEEQIKEASLKYNVGRSNFSANGRARSMDETEGFVKILVDQCTEQILGINIVGPHASELIAEAAIVMNFGGTVRDLASTCHAHPTLSEVVREAALDVFKEAIHI